MEAKPKTAEQYKESYKAGLAQGRKEVVEWVDRNWVDSSNLKYWEKFKESIGIPSLQSGG